MAIDTNRLRDKWYRMNELYQIVDKNGKTVRFRLNNVQETLAEALWHLNVILKARQEGMTTFTCIYFLDECLFNKNVEAGIIAHTKDDATDIFRRKVQFPYEHLDPDVQAKVRLITDSKREMGFSNGSVIHVGTSMRSATLQYLLVSELGKIAKKFPEKAREIMTGALEAVGNQDTLVFVESTGEGKSGAFYDLCDTAQKYETTGRPLTRMDYRLHFFPWYLCLDYTLDEPVMITKEMKKYLEEMQAECGIRLTKQQIAWYVKKHEILGEDIKREYPFTPDEAFESGIKGTYFKSQFTKIRRDGRICRVPHTEGIMVDTWWDLGMDDSMSIWFTQDVGREIHCVNYYESSGEGMAFYREVLDDLSKEHGYRYGRMVGPHDLKVRELGTGVSRVKAARQVGLDMEIASKVEKKMDSIMEARRILSVCWFDEENCDKGIEHLEGYRKQWDDINGVYKNNPLHNEHSHGADAYQTLAIAHDFRPAAGGGRRSAKARKITRPSAKGWT